MPDSSRLGLRYALEYGRDAQSRGYRGPEQSFQLEHPSSEVIWKRAVEVFGSEDLARKWMDTPLPILGQSTPEQFSSSDDPAKQREILTILGRIDYGIFS